MNTGFYRTGRYFLLATTVMIVMSLLFSYAAAGNLSNRIRYTDVSTKTSVYGSVLSDADKTDADSEAQKIYNPNLHIADDSEHDKSYMKYINRHLKSGMLFEAFVVFITLALHKKLRNDKREFFEYTSFRHILDLMNYIHKMDGGTERYFVCRSL